MEAFITYLEKGADDLIVTLKPRAQKLAETIWANILALQKGQWKVSEVHPYAKESMFSFSSKPRPPTRKLKHIMDITTLFDQDMVELMLAYRDTMEEGMLRTNYLHFLSEQLALKAGTYLSKGFEMTARRDFVAGKAPSEKDTEKISLIVSYSYQATVQ